MEKEQMVRWFLLLFLMLNTIWDVKRRQVLLWSILLFGIAGVFLVFRFQTVPVLSCLGGVIFGMAIGGCGYITRQAIGYGDGLVIMVCGIYLGFAKTFAMVFYGMLFCSLLSMVLIAAGRRTYKTQVPFLPYLLLGYVCVILLG